MSHDLQPKATPRLGLLLSGYGILLIASYLDNIRGPLLPSIAKDLNLNFSASGQFLALGQLGAVLAYLFMLVLATRLKNQAVVTASMLFGAAAGLLAGLAKDQLSLGVLAITLGISIALMGMMCNLLVIEGSPVATRGRWLAGLHATYGLGSLLAGILASQILAHQLPWRWLFWAIVPVCLVFLAISYASARKPSETNKSEDHTATPQRPLQAVSHRQLAERAEPGYGGWVLAGATALTYVAGEVGTTMWLSSFLVHARAADDSAAAMGVSGFFLAMTLTRLGCVFLPSRWEGLMLKIALLLPILAFLVSYYGDYRGFALVGLCGPFYPLLLAHLSRVYHRSWRRLAIFLFLCAQAGLVVVNYLIGQLSDRIGIEMVFLAPPMLLGTALLLTWFQLSYHGQDLTA